MPLAVEFGKRVRTIGFDLLPQKIEAYRRYIDPTGEVSSEELKAARSLEMTADPQRLADCTFYIVAVPTPIDSNNRPDLGAADQRDRARSARTSRRATSSSTSRRSIRASPRRSAARSSTRVRPAWNGVDLLPRLLARAHQPGRQGAHVREDHEGRLGPGRRDARARRARSTASVVTAGVHRAPSIKVAEAAKVIENTQRDLNIALMNELALIFDRMGIRTADVLEAAGTKWNFLRVHARPRRRSLHRRRSVLPDARRRRSSATCPR